MVGRNTSGVIIFRTNEAEHVAGVERLEGEAGADDDAEQSGGDEDAEQG
jgi:hypothetical protein